MTPRKPSSCSSMTPIGIKRIDDSAEAKTAEKELCIACAEIRWV